DGERPVPYVDFVCTIPDLNGLFGMVASDMLGSLRRGDTDVYGRCRNVLERWRRMLGSARRGVLSEGAQAALLAELIVLERIVRIEPSGVRAWLGPEGAPHDFVCGSIDIEVKSSLKTSGDIVEINGLGQLEPKPGSELYLQFLKLLKAPGRGRSLV